MSNLTTSVINVAFSLISTFMKIILAPIDTLIMQLLPDVSTMIGHISNFLTMCFSSIGWVLDIFAIPSGAISLIISYFVLKYSIHLTVVLVKIIFSWIRGLK